MAPNHRHTASSTGFTADPIVTPLKFWLAKLGLDAKVSLADYNQIFQELMDPTSPARRNRPRLRSTLESVRIEREIVLRRGCRIEIRDRLFGLRQRRGDERRVEQTLL